LISDTHALLRQEALDALAGSNLIIHAGDIGKPEIVDSLNQIAPVVAIRGNVDTAAWAKQLPTTAVADADGSLIYVLHDLNQLDLDPAAAGFEVVVSGHSHNPSRTERSGVLYINPGSAGPRRFKLPITVARMERSLGGWEVAFIDLEQRPSDPVL
jgi:putative phosphoesterase